MKIEERSLENSAMYMYVAAMRETVAWQYQLALAAANGVISNLIIWQKHENGWQTMIATLETLRARRSIGSKPAARRRASRENMKKNENEIAQYLINLRRKNGREKVQKKRKHTQMTRRCPEQRRQAQAGLRRRRAAKQEEAAALGEMMKISENQRRETSARNSEAISESQYQRMAAVAKSMT